MTKADDAYQRLCSMIEACVLIPGENYTEQALIDMVELGRTPVREAIQRLTREHLIVAANGSSVHIPSLSVDEQIGRLEIRRPLESLVVTLAAHRATPTERASLQACLEREGLEELSKYMDFLRDSQQLVSAASHNSYLVEIMKPLYVHSRRFWQANLQNPAGEMKRIKQFHFLMLSAVCSGDAQKAQESSLELNDFLVESALRVSKENATLARATDGLGLPSGLSPSNVK